MEEQQFGCFLSSKCPKEKAPSLDRLGAFIFCSRLHFSSHALLETKFIIIKKQPFDRKSCIEEYRPLKIGITSEII
jgi:hypothetical protein